MALQPVIIYWPISSSWSSSWWIFSSHFWTSSWQTSAKTGHFRVEILKLLIISSTPWNPSSVEGKTKARIMVRILRFGALCHFTITSTSNSINFLTCLTLLLPAYHCRQWKSWCVYVSPVAKGLSKHLIDFAPTISLDSNQNIRLNTVYVVLLTYLLTR